MYGKINKMMGKITVFTDADELMMKPFGFENLNVECTAPHTFKGKSKSRQSVNSNGCFVL